MLAIRFSLLFSLAALVLAFFSSSAQGALVIDPSSGLQENRIENPGMEAAAPLIGDGSSRGPDARDTENPYEGEASLRIGPSAEGDEKASFLRMWISLPKVVDEVYLIRLAVRGEKVEKGASVPYGGSVRYELGTKDPRPVPREHSFFRVPGDGEWHRFEVEVPIRTREGGAFKLQVSSATPDRRVWVDDVYVAPARGKLAVSAPDAPPGALVRVVERFVAGGEVGRSLRKHMGVKDTRYYVTRLDPRAQVFLDGERVTPGSELFLRWDRGTVDFFEPPAPGTEIAVVLAEGPAASVLPLELAPWGLRAYTIELRDAGGKLLETKTLPEGIAPGKELPFDPAVARLAGLLEDVAVTTEEGQTRVRFRAGGIGGANVRILDGGGRLVRALAEGMPCAFGEALDLGWDGRDDFGERVPKGTYRAYTAITPTAGPPNYLVDVPRFGQGFAPTPGEGLFAVIEKPQATSKKKKEKGAADAPMMLLGDPEEEESDLDIDPLTGEGGEDEILAEVSAWTLKTLGHDGEVVATREIWYNSFGPIALDSHDRLYTIDPKTGSLLRFDAEGRVDTGFGEEGRVEGVEDGRAIVIDERGDGPADDRIYVVDWIRGILCFDVAGAPLASFAENGVYPATPEGEDPRTEVPIYMPNSLAIDRGGNLYVGHGLYKAAVTALDPEGRARPVFYDAMGRPSPTLLVLDAEVAYMVNQKDGGVTGQRVFTEEITVMGMKMTVTRQAGTDVSGKIHVHYRTVTSLAVNDAGEIYVVTGFRHEPGRRIQKYSPRGTLLFIHDGRPDDLSRGIVGREFGDIVNLAIGPDGELLAHDGFDLQVLGLTEGTAAVEEEFAYAPPAAALERTMRVLEPLPAGTVADGAKGRGVDWERNEGLAYAKALEIVYANPSGEVHEGTVRLSVEEMPTLFDFNARAYLLVDEKGAPVACELADADGDMVEEVAFSLNVPAGKARTLRLVTTNGPVASPAFLQEKYGLDVRLVDYVRCFDPPRRPIYRDDGGARVVRKDEHFRYRLTPFGRSRWFRYWMQPGTVGRPHFLVVEHPNDEERIVAVLVRQEHTYVGGVNDWQGLDGGYQTARFLPPTDEYLMYSTFVYPRVDRFTFYIMSYDDRMRTGQPGPNAGAAASRMWLFEIENELPANPIEDETRRYIGTYLYAPAIPLSSFGAPIVPAHWKKHGHAGKQVTTRRQLAFLDKEWTLESLRNMRDYFRYIGLNFMSMPVIWVNPGIYYPSKFLKDAFTKNPPTHFDLAGQYLEAMQDLEMEFVALYQRLNFRPHDAPADWYQTTASGKVETTWWEGGGLLDPLHPEAQDYLVAAVRDGVEHYAPYENFKGIQLDFQASLPKITTTPLYPTIEFGFSRGTVEKFLKDTGIKLEADKKSDLETLDEIAEEEEPPADTDAAPPSILGGVEGKGMPGMGDADPGVAAEAEAHVEYIEALPARAREILQKHREAWVEWRCRGITAFLVRLRDMVKEVRPDLDFYISGSFGRDSREQGQDVSMLREAGLKFMTGAPAYHNRRHVFPDEGPAPATAPDPLVRSGSTFYELRPHFGMESASAIPPVQRYPMSPFSYILEYTNPRSVSLGSWALPTFGSELTLRDFIRGFRILPVVPAEPLPDAVPANLREAKAMRAYRYREGKADYMAVFNHTVETLEADVTLPVKKATVREMLLRGDLPVEDGKVRLRLAPRAMAVLKLGE